MLKPHFKALKHYIVLDQSWFSSKKTLNILFQSAELIFRTFVTGGVFFVLGSKPEFYSS